MSNWIQSSMKYNEILSLIFPLSYISIVNWPEDAKLYDIKYCVVFHWFGHFILMQSKVGKLVIHLLKFSSIIYLGVWYYMYVEAEQKVLFHTQNNINDKSRCIERYEFTVTELLQLTLTGIVLDQ